MQLVSRWETCLKNEKDIIEWNKRKEGTCMKVCCFTGHRALPRGETERLTAVVRPLVLHLIREGVTEFRVGGAVGFDMIMAELLLQLRDEEKQKIRIVSVIPYPDWREKWKAEDRVRQDRILKGSNQVVYVRQSYCKGVYMIRNRALVDGAAFCIAYCTGSTGGTAWTVEYAKLKGLKVYNMGSSV